MQNPSLREEPRNRKATIIPSKDSMSILDWMRKQGRLIEQAPEPAAPLAEEDIEDIDDLIGDEEFGDFDDDD